MGILVRTTDDVLFQDIYNSQKWFYSLFALAVITSLIITYKISNSVSLKLEKIIKNLSKPSNEVAHDSNKITTSSGQLSLAINQQAASLQETSATIEEISSIVNKNSDQAKDANLISSKSLKSAQVGTEVVSDLVKAINSISVGTNDIANQIDQTNQEIQVEINKAVMQLDLVTQQNTETTSTFNVTAETLSAQAKDLNVIINDLHYIVSATKNS